MLANANLERFTQSAQLLRFRHQGKKLARVILGVVGIHSQRIVNRRLDMVFEATRKLIADELGHRIAKGLVDDLAITPYANLRLFDTSFEVVVEGLGG